METEGAAAGCGGSGDHGDVAMADSSGLKRGRGDDDFIAPNKPARVEPSPSESGLPLTNLFGPLQTDSMLHTDVMNPPSLYSGDISGFSRAWLWHLGTVGATVL